MGIQGTRKHSKGQLEKGGSVRIFIEPFRGPNAVSIEPLRVT